MKIKDKIKASHSELQSYYYRTASLISELGSDIEKVEVTITRHFISGVIKTTPETFNMTLTPNDRAYIHYDCANGDCTGEGFALSNILYESIKTRKELSGKLICKGKEDWKYLNSSGCGCSGWLTYTISPKFV